MPFTVEDLAHAQRIWEEINKRYAAAFSGSSAEERRLYKEPPQHKLKEFEDFKERLKDPEEQAKFNSAATIIAKQWEKRQQSEALMQVNPQGYHSDSVTAFLSNQKIKKSVNKKKLDELSTAIKDKDWSNPIFHEKDLPHYAFTLFDRQQITRHQLSTLLDRHQAASSEKEIGVFNILNPDGSFSKEAEEMLLPNMKMYLKMTDLQKNNFRLLLEALPPSERIVYYTVTMNTPEKLEARRKTRSIDTDIYEEAHTHFQHTDKATKEDYNLHLAFGATDAMSMMRLGPEHLVSAIPALGSKSIDEVENYIREMARVAAMAFPETIAYPGEPGTANEDKPGIHDYLRSTRREATMHDQFHAALMTAITLPLRLALLRIIDVLRTDVGQKWSPGIWALVDAAILPPFKNRSVDPDRFQEPRYLPGKLIELLNAPYSGDIQKRPYLGLGIGLFHEYKITDLGVLVAIDMAFNQEAWKKINIDPASLEMNPQMNLKGAFTTAQKIKDYLEVIPTKENTHKLSPQDLKDSDTQNIATKNILKFRIFEAVKTKIPEYKKLLEEHPELTNQELFNKYAAKNPQFMKNPNDFLQESLFIKYAQLLDKHPEVLQENNIRFVPNRDQGFLGLMDGKKDLKELKTKKEPPLDIQLVLQKLDEKATLDNEAAQKPKSPRPRA